MANPFDPSIWNITLNGATTKVKIPKINETDTKLSANYNDATLIYNAEKHTDIITGSQLGGLITLDDLRDTNVTNADSCDLLVYNPGCDDCGAGCKPKVAQWTKYHIPSAGECIIEPDNDGYYRLLVKDDCGCIKECRLPVMGLTNGSTAVSYIRDSVPDDPDYPWYYGCYNDTINLHLRENAPRFFGKYDLEITINYGIQVTHPTVAPNTNFRSLLVPFIEDSDINTAKFASILQDQSTVNSDHPWGTVSLRGSLSFIAPKGKEVKLRHEFRLRTLASRGRYVQNPLDRQKVPDSEAGQVDHGRYTMSRLNALQLIVKPSMGTVNTDPVVDPIRDLLDRGTEEDDSYPNVGF